MGTTVIGGMLAATLIGVFLIPAIFYVVERISGAANVGTPQLTSAAAPGEAD
jgi:HAE1 family hydrophobic/amphiphilic exporter-1